MACFISGSIGDSGAGVEFTVRLSDRATGIAKFNRIKAQDRYQVLELTLELEQGMG